MTFTAAELKKAFSPASTVLEKQTAEVIEIDLESMASGMIEKMAEIAESEGGEDELAKALAAFSDHLDAVDETLEKAEENGLTVTAPETEVTKQFGFGKKPKGKESAKKPKDMSDDAKKSDGEGEPQTETPDPAATEDKPSETDTEKMDLSNDIEWDGDLSPAGGKDAMLRKSERMTKGERPISARSGQTRRDQSDKYHRARERAMSRSGRSMS